MNETTIINKDHWWPTPIWYFDIDPSLFDFKKITEEAYEIRKADGGRTISNYGGWQSNSVDMEKDTEMNKMMKYIEDKVGACFNDIGARDTVNKKITDYWININKRGDYNRIHTHALSTLSGCVYLKTDKDSGNILFHRNASDDYYYLELTHHQDGSGSDTNPYQFSHIFYEPVPYRVLVFPSILPHSVDASKSDEDRISIAFNFSKNWG